MKNFSTISELLAFQNKNFRNEKAFSFKENDQVRSFSNQEFYQNCLYFACALKDLGLRKNQKISNISYQNPIWLNVDFGSILAGAVTVPIFYNISNENLFYELKDSDVKFVFTDDEAIFDVIKKQFPKIKFITYGFKKRGAVTFEDFLKKGKKLFESKKYQEGDLLKNNKADDLATIIYTSGSTGKPKGVELTHKNLISQVKATQKCFKLDKNKDVILSFLPLAHIFERMVVMFYISKGVSIYFADDIKNLGNIIKEVRPTLMTTVPRMLEKVYVKIRDGVNEASFIKRALGGAALKRALNNDPTAKKTLLDKFFARIIYKKFLQGLGGRMRMIICGGAALSVDLQKFYQNIGVNLFCGYGMTETSPVISVNYPKNHKINTVGKVFDGVKVKIAKDGELLASGPGVMRGYHKKPAETAKVIKNGWMSTGDLAKIDKAGYIEIVGRKKEVFKNANGKYIRPTVIEQKLVQKIGFLVGAVVIGEEKKFTSALIFCDFELLEKAKKKLKFVGSDKAFLSSGKLKEFMQRKIREVNKGLDHHEQIQKFYIAQEEISIESGEITPSMKLKRGALEEKYSDAIKGFYQ